MTKFTTLHRTLSSILAAALALGSAAPSYALKQTQTEQSAGLEELKGELLKVARAVFPSESPSPASSVTVPLAPALTTGLEEEKKGKKQAPDLNTLRIVVYGRDREHRDLFANQVWMVLEQIARETGQTVSFDQVVFKTNDPTKIPGGIQENRPHLFVYDSDPTDPKQSNALALITAAAQAHPEVRVLFIYEIPSQQNAVERHMPQHASASYHDRKNVMLANSSVVVSAVRQLVDALSTLVPETAGLEEWGPGPSFRLYPNPAENQNNRAVIHQFTPRGDQLWMTLLEQRGDAKARVGFVLTDSQGNRISQADSVVHRVSVLEKIIRDAEAGRLLPQDTWDEIWLRGEGRLDFKNPKTVQVLKSPPVLQALAENKETILFKEREPKTGEDPRLLVLTLELDKESAVVFHTAGNDSGDWSPFAEIVIIGRERNNTRFSFSSLRGVGIDREKVFRKRQKPSAEPAAGLEESGIGSLPTTHQIDYHFSGQFLSGRVPAEEDAAHLLGTRGIPHAQLATEWIGVTTVFEDLIGAGRGLDTVQKRGIVDRADLRAQEIQDQVARAQGVLLQHVNFETKGLTPGGLQAGAVGGDPQGKPTPTISDVIEHTTAFVEGEPGASSMQMEGPGAETFGSFPDEARALMVVTHTDPAKEAAVLRQYGVQTIDELLDPEFPVNQLVRRVAELNGVHFSQVDVILLTNDEADMEALRSLQETYEGLRVHRVTAGTVVPSLAAVWGVNDGRVRLFLRRSGMTEAVFVTLLAGLYSADGSYANFRVVSEEVKSEFGRRYIWNQRVLGQMEALRPDDWKEIRDGKKIFSSRQATLPVTGAYTFLTNGRTDLEMPFSVDGVRQDGGVSTISSLIFTSHPINRGAGYLWLSRNSYTLPAPEVHQAGLEEAVTVQEARADVHTIELQIADADRRGDESLLSVLGTALIDANNHLGTVLAAQAAVPPANPTWADVNSDYFTANSGLEETVFLSFDGAAGLALAQAGLEALVVVPTPTDFRHQVELGLAPERAIGLLWGGLEEKDYWSIAPIGSLVTADPGSSTDWQRQVIAAVRAGLGPQRNLQVVFDSLTLASGLEELGIPGSTVQEILQVQAQRAADLAQMK